MITIKKSNITETITIPVPHNTDFEMVAPEHQITIECSEDCNAGMTATLSVTPIGAAMPGDVEDGTIDCYEFAGKSVTIDITRRILAGVTLSISGRVTGAVNLFHTPWNMNDKDHGHTTVEG